VGRVLAHLRAGDCYQVNLSRRLIVSSPGDPFLAWLRLRASNPARRAILVETPVGAIVSNSPELLLRARGRRLLSVPIKGTAPLGSPPISLLRSAKERAELTMIVDLVRSDLGRVAAPGSVEAGPRRVGPVGHVLHAMQRVQARLEDGKTGIDAIEALFPPGSVTGAPKVRAMELIAELESCARGAYCGAIGMIGGERVDLNVAIRTVSFVGGEAHVQVGAGIVIGSSPEREFEETELKARRMLEALC
jgi:anthranilate/para-aminobenzoate synthase component I